MKTFKINSEHYISKDSYENGELDFYNSYSTSTEIEAETPRQAIEKYFENELYFDDFSFEQAEVDDENDNVLHYSTLVDGNNCEVKAGSIYYNKWKKGDIILYSDRTRISVFEITPVSIKG